MPYRGTKGRKSKIPRRPLLKAMTFTSSLKIAENDEKNSSEDDNEGIYLLRERLSESQY